MAQNRKTKDIYPGELMTVAGGWLETGSSCEGRPVTGDEMGEMSDRKHRKHEKPEQPGPWGLWKHKILYKLDLKLISTKSSVCSILIFCILKYRIVHM